MKHPPGSLSVDMNEFVPLKLVFYEHVAEQLNRADYKDNHATRFMISDWNNAAGADIRIGRCERRMWPRD